MTVKVTVSRPIVTVVRGALQSGSNLAAMVKAKGDLFAGKAPATLDVLTVGSDGDVLTVDSAAALGIKWAPAAGGGGAVDSVNGKTGVVVLAAADVGADAAGTAASAVSTHAALTSSVHGISAFGATLVDDVDAAAARTTLQLGVAAQQDGRFGPWQGFLGNGNWYPLGMRSAVAFSNAVASTANRVYVLPFALPQRVTLSNIGVYTVSGAAGTVRIGIYRATGARAGTKLIDHELTPSDAAAQSTANTTVLEPGSYFAAIHFSDSSVILRGHASADSCGSIGRPDCGATSAIRAYMLVTRTYASGLPTELADMMGSEAYPTSNPPLIFVQVP